MSCRMFIVAMGSTTRREERLNIHDPEASALDHCTPAVALDTGTPRTYAPDAHTDNRSVWGAALLDIAEDSPEPMMTAMLAARLIMVKSLSKV